MRGRGNTPTKGRLRGCFRERSEKPAKGWGLGSETPAEGVSGQLGKPAASIASAYAICPATFGCRLEALGPVGP